MSRRITVLGLLPGFLLITACGSAQHPAKPGSSASSSASTPSTSTATSSVGASTAQPSSTTGSGAGAGAGTGAKASGGGATNARVPATFKLAAGGKLVPPSISSPAFLAVQLTIVSADGKGHRVLVRTPVAHALTVPARGRASVLIPGLRAGRYELDVDGVARGALMIGGEPGP